MIGTVILSGLATLLCAVGFTVFTVRRAQNSAQRIDSLREDEDRAAREGADVSATFGNAAGYEVKVRQA